MKKVEFFLLILLSSHVTLLEALRRDDFVNIILSEYKVLDQASQADTNRDGVVTDAEFNNNLYKMADYQGNRDDEVSRDELIDYYRLNYNISSELATIMFDQLNDQKQPDDVINSRDVSLMTLSGKNYISLNEYRNVLEEWIGQSAVQLFTLLMSPTIMASANKLEMNYANYVNNVDGNRDRIITLYELTQEISRLNSGGGQVRRRDWVRRDIQTYSADPVAANLVFDFWDRDGDLMLTSSDLQFIMRESDFNEDGIVSAEELLRFIERTYKLSHKVSGSPVSPTLIQCPEPWWSELGWTADIDSSRFVMDLDDDFNGWISVEDLNRWLQIFDENNDSFISRNEYTKLQWQRYRTNTTTSSVMFDLSDVNNDGRLDQNDWLNYFRGGQVVSFCDAKLSIQNLVRMAQQFQQISKIEELRLAVQKRLQEELQYFLQHRDTFLNRQPRELCAGHVTCYVGDVSEDWWRPEAWLWWGVYLPDAAPRPGAPPYGDFHPFNHRLYPSNQGTPGALTGGDPTGRGPSGSNWPQWSASDPSNMRYLDSLMPFFTLKRSTNVPLRGEEKIPRSNKVNYFNPFRHQFSSNSESDRSQTESEQTSPAPDDREPSADSLSEQWNRNLKSESQDSREVPFKTKDISDNVPRQSNHSQSTDSTTENTSAADRKSQNVSDTQPSRQYNDPMPDIGYPPFMFGVDPWMMPSFPVWPMYGRHRRSSADQKEAQLNDNTDRDKHSRDLHHLNDDDVSLEKDELDVNDTNEMPHTGGWRPSFVLAPPMFNIPPWDPLLSWLAERDMLLDAMLAETLREMNHGKNSTGNTSSIQPDELEADFQENSEIYTRKKSEVEQKDGSNEEKQDDSQNKGREKRFLSSEFSGRFFTPDWFNRRPTFQSSWPNVYNWQMNAPLFPRQDWYRNQAFASENLRNSRYYNPLNVPNYQLNYLRRIRRTPSANENVREDPKPGERRDSPFNRWKNDFMETEQIGKTEKPDNVGNIWRGESQKYTNNWDKNTNTEDWIKQDKLNQDQQLFMQKLLQSTQRQDDFSRNLNPAYTGYKQRPADSFPITQSDLSSSPLQFSLLANNFWRNPVPQAMNRPNFYNGQWSESRGYDSNPWRHFWPNLYSQEQTYADSNVKDGGWYFDPQSLNRFDNSFYYPTSRLFRREKPESDKNDENNSSNEEELNKSNINDTSDELIRIKRWRNNNEFSTTFYQDWLSWVAAKCTELKYYGGNYYDYRQSYYWDQICPSFWRSNSHLYNSWRNRFPYQNWNNDYTNQLNRVKRNNEKYSRNPVNFDRYQSSSHSPYNGDCKELKYPFKSYIPWTSWNIVRSTWQGDDLQGASGELRNKFSPLDTEDRSKEKIFLCKRRDGQNNVYTYITRGQADTGAWYGRDRLGNSNDWNPYRGEGRAGPYWRAKKEMPNLMLKDKGKNGGSTERHKRWTTMNSIPWYTYQNSDWFYNGNNFVMYGPAARDHDGSRQKRWNQPRAWNPYRMYQDAQMYQPHAWNPQWMYQDTGNKNPYNPLSWNLFPGSMADMYGRYSRQSSADQALNPDRSPTWGYQFPSNVQRNEREQVGNDKS